MEKPEITDAVFIQISEFVRERFVEIDNFV